MAKLNTKIPASLEPKERGKYVVVCGITPTPLGEGKIKLMYYFIIVQSILINLSSHTSSYNPFN